MMSLRKEITAETFYTIDYYLLALKLNIKNNVGHKYRLKLSFSLLLIIFYEHQQHLNIFVTPSMDNYSILSFHYNYSLILTISGFSYSQRNQLDKPSTG